MNRLRILVLEPYYGGSHRAVLDGLLERLDVEADVLTLPARKWKWRMRGAAITMAQQARALHADRGAARPGSTSPDRCWDLVYASTFVNLAEFYGLAADAVAGVPSIVYFHENQLVYPNRHEAEWDFQFPLTNITSALAATRCLFNTEFTRDTFLGEIDPFIKQFPDFRPTGLARTIAAKSEVLAPPFDPAPFDAESLVRGPRPRVVWPHRWEHDKNPDAFFEAVTALAAEGLDFEVAIAGQEFRDVPDAIRDAHRGLGERLVHAGEPATRADYAALLRSSDIAVSTAVNEFFGLAMIESAYAGCFPLVPDSLAYPEIYPEQFRYAGRAGLADRLRALLSDPPPPGQGRTLAEEFTFDRLVPAYAEVFRSVSASQ